MGGFRTVGELVDAESSARNYAWRKTPNQVTTIGIWFDLSMSAGNPPPKFWFDATPLTSKIIAQSLDGGIFHGGNVAPKNKYLRKTTAMTSISTAAPLPMILCDYLMYYPTIGEDTTDEQFLTNSATLPRYTDGEGVQCLAISVAARTGGQTFTIKYTNSQGVSGRISPIVMQNTVSVIGSIVTSERQGALYSGAFMPLQAGDTGIRYIESVTMNGVDVGLFSLVLVKPLGDMMIRGSDAPVEVDWFLDKKEMPIIQDDAYLSWLCMPIFSLSNSPIIGTIKTITK